jgi:hypothetical protein
MLDRTELLEKIEAGGWYAFEEEYDLRNEGSLQQLDDDSAIAMEVVRELDLNYGINAKHWATVVDDRSLTDMVTVKWKFWPKEERDVD